MTKFKGIVKRWAPPALADIYRRVRNVASLNNLGDSNKSRPGFLLPTRQFGELFPGIEQLTVEVGSGELIRPPDMVMPLPELLTLASICRFLKPRRVFEIGTYTGSTTLAMAMNAPQEAEIFTLDLDPAQLAFSQSHSGLSVPQFEPGIAFRTTRHAARIRQLYGSSREFDFIPYRGTIDLVLVDADHTYDHVRKDSEAAIAMCRDGGVVIWDDYLWTEAHAECAGVTRCLDELRGSLDVVQLAGTRLAVFVKPHSSPSGVRFVAAGGTEPHSGSSKGASLCAS
jgi:predicted O-methyltransferase YrrM